MIKASNAFGKSNAVERKGLIFFRRNLVALVCDIKEMFLQIEIPEKDRSYLRIRWPNLDANRKPQEYELNRVVFGNNSAPMEAQFV